MKKFILIALLSAFIFKAKSQTPKQVQLFPQEYLGKTITFKNIAYMPTLTEMKGMYLVGIDIEGEGAEEFGFGSLDKITGAVGASIAKQMSKKGYGGYSKFYYGSVTGKVVKKSLSFGSNYVFVISKIVNHWLGEENKPKEVFTSVK
jgi:hypothetical protein